ncbi:MAG TPA: tetratricopeptide repeat protein [Sphingomicrobium sp.]|nr:tetratricopeptide repeat protein [Sphingomicrobium sp.]
MKLFRPVTVIAAVAIALVPASAFAQRQQPTPEQRLERLEKQMDQVQRQVFPRGRPASTAGFSDDPAASQSSVITLSQRLDALEKQMANMLSQMEENGNRLRSLETGVGQMKADQEQRIQAIEQRVSSAEPVVSPTATQTEAPSTSTTPPKTKPASQPPKEKPKAADETASDEAPDAAAPSDPGEDAYSEGFHLWEDGKYDAAISSLKAFVKAYPKHRRVSFANNLIGRALLDKGEPREAATALLANYRGDPGGERAPDSLYYLGQALMKLDQPTQACKAYDELDAVYGSKIRPDLKKLETDAKAQAQCG